MPQSDFAARISEQIWDLKYRLKTPDGRAIDAILEDTFWRVARAVAAPEKGGKRTRERWATRFYDAISDFGFLPAGRILAGAGTGRAVTLFNCFVMGRIEDDLGSIFDGVKEAALTMQQGGGIGHDFSTLRPKGALVKSVGADASGPVSFMDVWDAMCRTIMSAGARRGAMMATLRCDHPDIETFIDVKSDPRRLRNFNLSVLVTEAFMAAVREDAPWDLVFAGKVYRTLPARTLWDNIMRATYEYAEPGVIFIDRINATNNLAYCEEIHATNPCGEQPLPPYGACLLGSINLARLVDHPFTGTAGISTAKLEERVRTAVRLLDNVTDISSYPLPAQRHEALSKRRIGLGVTGLADALVFCGARYGGAEAVTLAGKWMCAIQRAAYLASAELAADKGSFPLFDADQFLARPNVTRLDGAVREAIRQHGIRNGCLTSIAPTGTISLFAGNVSSGIEPIYDLVQRRRFLEAGGSERHDTVEDYAYALFRKQHGPRAPLSAAFVTTADLEPREHLEMQAAMQPYVDSSISKTINCPSTISFDAFKDVYLDAYAMGLKGCTTYRPNPVTGSVLEAMRTEGQEIAVVPSTEATPSVEGGREASRPSSTAPPAVAGSAAGLPDERVVYMAKPLERENVLSGFTYKLKWPGSDHAIYVTINDIEREGRRRPFEVFINTRNLEHYAWTVALTRMISAVFRRGGDVSFVADELKAVFDPQGGRWMGGRCVPSLLAAIGEVIEAHMIRIGFLQRADSQLLATEASWREAASGLREDVGTFRTSGAGLKFCPRCSSGDYIREEGCWVCRACGFSRCG